MGIVRAQLTTLADYIFGNEAPEGLGQCCSEMRWSSFLDPSFLPAWPMPYPLPNLRIPGLCLLAEHSPEDMWSVLAG